MKHIESIQPEYAADDLSRLLVREIDATASAALSRLLHRATGCDIPPLANTPQSEVEELVPLCLSILRRHWTTPLTCLGDGTTPMSLEELIRRVIGDRVQGNEALSIPAIHGDIPTAVSALLKRDISSGLTLLLPADGTTTSLLDGLSLAQVLCSGLTNSVTELKDENKGWTYERQFPWSIYTNLEKVTLGCSIAEIAIISGYPNIKEFHLPNLKVIGSYPKKYNDDCIYLSGNVEHLVFDSLETWYIHRIWSPSLKTITFKECVHFYGTKEYNAMFNTDQETLTITFEKGSIYETTGYNSFLFGGSNNLRVFTAFGLSAIEANNRGCINGSYPALEEIILPDCERIVGYSPSIGSANYVNLRKVQFGTIHSLAGYFTLQPNVNLIHLEFGQGTDCSLPLSSWSPTTALAERLDEFLSNFQQYIADRVADMTGKSALTLTLSAAVYEALQAQEGQTILATLTNKNWTVAQA